MNGTTVRYCIGSVPWWIVSFFGAVLILLGALCFFWTGPVVDIFLLITGIFLGLVGIVLVGISITLAISRMPWFPIFMVALVPLFFALVLFLLPDVFLIFAMYLVAILAIIIGIIIVLIGSTMAGRLRDKLVPLLIGMATLFCGVYIAVFPASSAIVLVKLAGLYGIVLGLLVFLGGFSMRREFCSYYVRDL